MPFLYFILIVALIVLTIASTVLVFKLISLVPGIHAVMHVYLSEKPKINQPAEEIVPESEIFDDFADVSENEFSCIDAADEEITAEENENISEKAFAE